MNRFLLFAGSATHPGGGFRDFRGSFEDAATATEHAKGSDAIYDWWHVVDLIDGKIVEHGLADHYYKGRCYV